jgi:HK97 family phage portal protein
LGFAFLEVFSQGGPVHPTRAFYGKDQALGLPALYSGARLLADSVASLPLRIYTRTGSRGHAQRYYGPTIFDKPSVEGTVFDWMFTAMTSLVLQGNAWGYVTGRDGYGFPTGIEWIPPDDVDCVDDEMQPWNPLRTRIYVYGRLMQRDELFHVKAFSLAGRTEGISLLRAFAMTILAGIEAQRYGTDWYRSGGFPPGTFENTEIEISADQAEEVRALLTNTIQRRQPLVYGRDWKYTPISVPPNEAQFINAMQLNATQIAAILGLPPDRLGGSTGDSLHYSTQEQSVLQVIEALRPWLVRLETAFFELLPQNRYVRFNADALLKTDLQTRTNIYQIRDLEDLEPLPDGVGTETMPLAMLERMASTTRVIPTSMLPSLSLEMELAAKLLEDLAAKGLAASDDPAKPPVVGPEQYLGRQVSSIRSAGVESQRDISLILDFLAHRRAAAAHGRPEPEFVGAWIPNPRELVLSGVNGHNGSNGHNGDGR